MNMMNIRKYIFLLVGLLLPMMVAAQKESAIDPKAKSLLDKSIKAFDAKKGALALFSVNINNARNNQSDSFEGSIHLKGEKFKLSLRDISTLFDGKTQTVLMMKEKEVTISEPDKDELKEINPLLLMKSYQTDFKMRYIGTVQEGNLSCEKVELYPNDLKSNYSIVTLLVEKNTLQPKSISLKGKDGLTTTFVIKNLDHSKTIADEEFVFDTKKYNSFEVIDLR
jgi:outer membrane lipoprotein-sorting protein